VGMARHRGGARRAGRPVRARPGGRAELTAWAALIPARSGPRVRVGSGTSLTSPGIRVRAGRRAVFREELPYRRTAV
jgi:hypothetical protein